MKFTNFLAKNQRLELEDVLLRHHKSWIKKNEAFYKEKAVNSAYLTHKDSCSAKDRSVLFQLIASKKIYLIANEIIKNTPVRFLNTQVFFDPFNPQKKNYWHRDIQYTNLSLEAQKQQIEKRPNSVLHFRFAMRDEYGIELIPGSHCRWDTEEEERIRLEQLTSNSCDPLPGSRKIELNRGDLLVFSANMIHRGQYGKDRLSLDILYCENDPDILQYRDLDCLPDRNELFQVDYPGLFE